MAENIWSSEESLREKVLKEFPYGKAFLESMDAYRKVLEETEQVEKSQEEWEHTCEVTLRMIDVAPKAEKAKYFWVGLLYNSEQISRMHSSLQDLLAEMKYIPNEWYGEIKEAIKSKGNYSEVKLKNSKLVEEIREISKLEIGKAEG